MSTEFYCKYCAIACTGKTPFEQHLQSAKHLKKANENPSTSPKLPTSPKPVSQSTSSASNITTSEDLPISSASYSISPETMRILLEWNHPHGYRPYCDICQLPLHGDDTNNADIHFSSMNHIHHQKLAVWKTIREGDAPYSCGVCSEIFSNENTMREHFNTDAHANMVQQKTNLKKFIQIYQTYEKVKQARIQRKTNPAAFETHASSTVDDGDLSNQFDKLKVTAPTEQNSQPKKTLFSFNKLKEAISKTGSNDDDD